MKKILVPTRSVDDWKSLLADPDKHWREGFSAKSLADSWENAAGFPDEIRELFANAEDRKLNDPELLIAIPEYQVPLPGGVRPSQNDLFFIARIADGLISGTVEGKAEEDFGPTIKEWSQNGSSGRDNRLTSLKRILGLDYIPDLIRYQLVHRLASAIIEAKKFLAPYAIMIVHSFSKGNTHLDDYETFIQLFAKQSVFPGRLLSLGQKDSIKIYSGWVPGKN